MKNKIFGSAIISSIILMNGCAQTPESIKPAYVSPLTYEKYGCTQLKNEAIRVNTSLKYTSIQQNKKAENDAVSLGTYIFTSGLYVQSMGIDQEERIANLKGQYKAIIDVSAKKNCSFLKDM